MDLHVPLDKKQYHYLQQRAQKQGTTVENIVVDLIDEDISWRQTLENDPVAAIFGEISDTLDSREIDPLLYYPSPAS